MKKAHCSSVVDHVKTILQKKDANPNIILPKQGISPFHLAVGSESEEFAEEVTRLFLQHGGNPNVRSAERQTPVHVAAAWGRANILQLLLLNGGDPWLHDGDDNNAFHYAYQERHWNIVDILQSFRFADLLKEDDSRENFILTFERVFLHCKNIAYEYAVDQRSAFCTQKTGSIPIQISTTPKSSPLFAENDHIHKMLNRRHNIEINSDCNVASQTCHNFSPDISEIAMADHTGNITRESNIIQEPVSADRTCGVSVVAKEHLCVVNQDWRNNSFNETSNNESPTAKDLAIADNCYSSLKVKLLEELKSFHRCNSDIEKEQNLCKNVELNSSNPDRSLEGSCVLNVKHKTEPLSPESLEDSGLRIQNLSAIQFTEVSLLNDESETISDEGKKEQFVVDMHSERNVPSVNIPVIKSDMIMLDNKHKIFGTDNDTGINSITMKNGAPESEWDNEMKNDRTKLSSDYITCDDESSTIAVPGPDEVLPFRCKASSNTVESMTSTLSDESFVSLCEEYKYSDEDGGVVFLERRFLVPTISVSDLHSERAESQTVNAISSSPRMKDKGQYTESDTSIPSSLDYDTDVLRGKLKERGYIPGPITSTTKKLYLRKLIKLQKNPIQLSAKTKVYSPELQRTLHAFNWHKWLTQYLKLEKEVAQQFSQADPMRRWREGIIKSSFTYLLLDPRVTDNLPCRVDCLNQSQIWSIFLSSVFYVGKGKRSRPYSHLYQAFNVWSKKTMKKVDKKVQYILDIWKTDMGVVCLHVFQNVIPVEAYTHEAAMIDAIGLQNLKNARSGEYYGVAATWTSHQKRMLGTYLLYRAMCIFLYEGERQLRPGDIG